MSAQCANVGATQVLRTRGFLKSLRSRNETGMLFMTESEPAAAGPAACPSFKRTGSPLSGFIMIEKSMSSFPGTSWDLNNA